MSSRSNPEWTGSVNVNVPSAARMYDYWLGGSHNFAADREAAEAVLATRPGVRYMARANRAFVGRAVRFLAGSGIRQFLDLGSGIPTVDSVHAVASRTAPDARVVYVDIDPVAVAHSAHLLPAGGRAAVILADLRKPAEILDHPSVRSVLDPDLPTAVLMMSVLQFVAGREAYDVVGHVASALAPGSYLAVSHICQEAVTDAAERDRIGAVYRRTATSEAE